MKKIISTLSHKWPEYLIEAIVIVASILGAFALENWSQDNQIKKRSADLLYALKKEYQSNKSQLERGMVLHEYVQHSSHELIRLIHTSEKVPVDTLKSLIARTGWLFTFDPQNSSLTSAISSGDIHAIENEELKEELLGWIDLSKDVQEEELLAQSNYYSFFYPFTLKYISWTELSGFYYPGFKTQSPYASDYKAMVYNRDFENLIAMRYENTLEILKEMQPILNKNNLILELIEKELNRMEE